LGFVSTDTHRCYTDVSTDTHRCYTDVSTDTHKCYTDGHRCYIRWILLGVFIIRAVTQRCAESRRGTQRIYFYAVLSLLVLLVHLVLSVS